MIGCHLGHILDFTVALTFYLFVWPLTFPEAGTWQLGWAAKVVAFNLGCEVREFMLFRKTQAQAL